MSTRSVKKRRLKKYATGDMRERITLYNRAITAPVFNSAAFTETYDAGTTVWARAQSIDYVGSGDKQFDAVQVADRPTDLFIIRFRSNVTAETIIRWEGNAYEILSVTDIDRRGMYLELLARIKGDQTKATNT
jgi:SPP1 family predicted phage head-tail adaptor